MEIEVLINHLKHSVQNIIYTDILNRKVHMNGVTLLKDYWKDSPLSPSLFDPLAPVNPERLPVWWIKSSCWITIPVKKVVYIGSELC
jgi:hypothetical protein